MLLSGITLKVRKLIVQNLLTKLSMTKFFILLFGLVANFIVLTSFCRVANDDTEQQYIEYRCRCKFN